MMIVYITGKITEDKRKVLVKLENLGYTVHVIVRK